MTTPARNETLWIYGTHRSSTNSLYGVGGTTWHKLYGKYIDKIPAHIIKSYDIIEYCHSATDEFSNKVTEIVNSSNTVLQLLLIQSSFVNAYGVFEKNFNIWSSYINKAVPRHPPAPYVVLLKNYTLFYNLVAKRTSAETLLALFITPHQFKYLADKNSTRPLNPLLPYIKEQRQALTNEEVIRNYTLKPSSYECTIANNDECMTPFKNVTNPLFKPFIDELVCYCSHLKQQITQNRNLGVITFNRIEDVDKMSYHDFMFFRFRHQITNSSNLPPILIKQIKNTYLSQLFEKTCVMLYKPYTVLPKSDDEDDIINAAMHNEKILELRCRGYFNGNLGVFHTSILDKNPISTLKNSNVPVIFISPENGNVMYDFTAKNSFIFFQDVVKELIQLNVFIEIEKTGRYELNEDFDIETLECCKNLPQNDELKADVRNQFFYFIGNLMHLVVANSIVMPFKLSYVYIMKLFNITDFESSKEDRNLLISAYLLEKAPMKEIIQILEDPENLKKPHIIALFDKTLRGSALAKGVRMMNYREPVYNSDTKILLNNIEFYLCELARRAYNIPQNYIKSFFRGFKYTREFKKSNEYKLEIPKIDTYSFAEKLTITAKADKYLTENFL